MTLLIALGVLALPFLAWAAVTVVRSPWVALSLYAGSVPFGSAVRVPGLAAGGVGTLSSFLGFVAIGAFLLQLAGGWRRTPRLDPALPVWVMLLGVGVLSYLWSIAPAQTLDDLLVLAALVALYAVAVLTPAGGRERDLLEVGIVAGGVIVGMLALVDLATGSFAAGRSGRFGLAGGGAGGEADPNITAAALMLPLAIALGRAVRERWPAQWWWLAVSVLVSVGLLSTGSRGGLLGGLTVVVVLVYVFRRTGAGLRLAAAAIVVLTVAGAVAPDATMERLLTRRGSTGRTAIWAVAARECPTYCWIGSGWGTFPEVHQRALLSDPAAQGNQLRFESHSVWIGTLIEAGLPGLVLLIVGLALTVRSVRALPRNLRAPPLAGLAGLILTNSFLGTIEFKYFWLVLLYGVVVVNAQDPVGRGPRPAEDGVQAVRLPHG
ncbi:MAG: O-antigen ligase family protein [Actinobacteria bacterium]|nr:O-antigen ligase family protein [Actinomycetota bacterium]